MPRLIAILVLTLPLGCGSVRTPTAAADPTAASAESGESTPDPAGMTAPAAATAGDAPSTGPARVDFATQVMPILESCRPCHFEGGKMYEQLPFDRPATIRTLGERLFTRIREPEDQQVIRDFLAKEEAEPDPAPAEASVP